MPLLWASFALALVGVYLMLRAEYGPPFEGASLALVTSPYGLRVHPLSGETKLHNGVDFGVPIGTPLLATRSGVVDAVAPVDATSSGIWIRVRFADGWSASYLHCSAIAVSTGATVSRGQVIAYSGNTGGSTGPHLHYILRGPGGKSVDPLPYMGLT